MTSPITTTKTITRIPLEVEITSSAVCPFCWVGYKRIMKAITQAKEAQLPIDFTVKFAPFMLDPTLPKSGDKEGGEDKMARYIRRFGGKEKVDAMVEAMKERGLKEGIKFSYGGVVSHEEDNQRMIAKARLIGGEEGQLKFVEKVFKSYFEEEADPGSFEILSRDAAAVGLMTIEEALAFLRSDELRPEFNTGIRLAQARGISGVPFTILNGKLAISGAQETETFFEVFEKIAKGELKA